jgi:hypothetical protein
MIALILLLLAPALTASRITLIDEEIEVAARSVQALNVSLRQKRAVIEIRHNLDYAQGRPAVHLRSPLRAPGGSTEFVMVPPSREGAYRFPARVPGDYAVLVDNRRSPEPARVALEVTVVFGQPGAAEPASLSRTRRAAVVALSALFLLGVGYLSGRKLLGAFMRRPPAAPPPLSF